MAYDPAVHQPDRADATRDGTTVAAACVSCGDLWPCLPAQGGPAGIVAEFHARFGLPVADTPALPDDQDLRDLRADLMEEEYQELCDADDADDLVELADALADIVVVAYGTAATCGIDLDRVLAEVHRSNMSKLGTDGKPVLKPNGKVAKPDTFVEPDIAAVLARQIADDADRHANAGA